MGCAVLYFVRLAATLGAGFPVDVPVTVVLAAISLLTATLENNDDECSNMGPYAVKLIGCSIH